MIVVVTGASGFLGRATARRLIEDGHEVRTLQRRPSEVAGARDILGSINDQRLAEHAVAGADGIVHLAAKVSLAGDRSQFQRINVDGTRSMLDAAETAGVGRFVHVSSPSVAHLGVSLAGAGADPADPQRARGDYARTKAEAELLALGRDTAELRVLAIRPHLVWGPGDTQLVERVIARARAGRLPLLNRGTALIDTTYIDNAASGLAAALRSVEHAHGRAYLLTNGEPRPVGELLAGICLAAGVAPPRGTIPAGLARAVGSVVEHVWALHPGADEPPMTRFLAEQLSTAHWFDTGDTRRDLGWTPTVSIDEGLERLATHYRTSRGSERPHPSDSRRHP